MLFNYQIFIDFLRQDPNKKDCVELYEQYVEPLGHKPLKQERWFLELVKRFQFISTIVVPSELRNDFDWNLLMQLGASSLSSELGFKVEENQTHLIFRVVSVDQTVVKTLDVLWGFQILRLYEIFIEEQINLCGLCHQDEAERKAIFNSKKFMLERWNYRIQELSQLMKRA